MLRIRHLTKMDAFEDAQFQSAELCQPAQAANSGIAGIGGFVQVVEHLVTVVGTKRQGL